MLSLKARLQSPPHQIGTLTSLAATEACGIKLGQALSLLDQPHTVLLAGSMGSGKTTLCKSICQALGADPLTITSPTYTLVNIYPIPHSAPIYHADFYRLAESSENTENTENTENQTLQDMDITDWHNPAGITLIEWPELAYHLLPPEQCLCLKLSLPDTTPTHTESRVLSLWSSTHFTIPHLFAPPIHPTNLP